MLFRLETRRSTSGVFLICFDSELLLFKDVDDKFYGLIGCYLDLINDVSLGSQVKPKIMLVLTKSDLEDVTDEPVTFDQLQEYAKDKGF